MQRRLAALALAAGLAVAGAASAHNHGAHPRTNIVEGAVASPAHTTLVAAVQAAGLVDTLASPGPFTVFAPTNDAFAALPAGTVDTLLQPANRATLTKVLTYHVVPGRLAAADVLAAIQAGGGRAEVTTVSGDTLVASLEGGAVVITDENGDKATVVQTDLFQSNGVIHVTNRVSIPQ